MTHAAWYQSTTAYVRPSLGKSLWQRFIYRFYRNPIVLFEPGATLLFLLAQRFCTKGAGRRERHSVWRTNLMLVVVTALATLTIGWQTYLLVQLPVIVIGGGRRGYLKSFK